MKFDIDIAIFIAFLIINLICGLFASRGIKNIREYAVGNRNFSTATITATIVATWLSGATFTVTTTQTYSEGLYFIIPGLGDAISFFIVSYFYAPRMAEFLGKLSVAEAMGSLYGRYVRGVTAISGIFPAIGNVAMQFSILASLLQNWLGISAVYAIAASSFIIITYSTFGGIKSVTFTDVIQFFTFGIVIPMIAFLIWNSLTDTETLFNSIKQNPSFDYHSVFDYHDPKFLNILFLFLFFMIPGIDSAVFQRISMAKNTKQVAKSFLIAGFFVILCDLVVNTFIGVLLVADNAPMLDSDSIIPYILDHYLSSGFKGIFIIGILAMMMSTADSYINSSAVLFAYDSIKVIGIELTEKKQLVVVRVTALLIGILALLLSLFLNNLLELILSTYSFYMPIVSVPLILAIFGFRSTSRPVLIGMTAGFVTVIYFKFFSEIDSIIPGMLANLIFFIGSHYILSEQGGWIGIKDRTSLDVVKLKRKRRIHNFIELVKGFSLVKFSQNNTPKEKRIFVYFGLFCMVAMFSNAYSLPRNLQEQYRSILNPIYYSVLILSTIFITYPIWLEKFKNAVFISFLWNIAVFYNLAFCSCLLSIIGQFNQIQVVVLMASLIAIASLMRWQVAILIIIGGVVASIQYYKMYMGINFLPNYMNNLQFKISYALLLVSSMLIAFFKPKQEQYELTEQKVNHLDKQIHDRDEELEKSIEIKNEFLRNLQHEAHTPLVGITSMGQVLWENYDKFDENQRRQATKEIAQSSERLNSLVNNIIDLSKLSSLKYTLDKKPVNLSELVYSRFNHCKKLYLNDKELEFLTIIEPNIKIDCDQHYITSTIDNLIINAIQYSEMTGKIIIKLTKLAKAIEFSIQDEGIGIPQNELRNIFGAFVVSSKTHTPAGGRGVGLALCEKVIKAHNGTIIAESNGKKGSTFIVMLPKDV